MRSGSRRSAGRRLARAARPVQAALAVLVAAGLGAPARAESETWYAQRVTTGDVPLRVEHLWSKGARLRAESVVGGRPIVTLVNQDFYTVFEELDGQGVAIRRSKAARDADRRGERPFGHDADRLMREGAERVRTERLLGRPCDVYRLTDARGRREVWVTQDELRLPLRIETFDRASSATARVDYLDWTRGFAIPDSFFEPDPRIKLEQLEYEDYVSRAAKGPVGPAPVLFAPLLHGP